MAKHIKSLTDNLAEPLILDWGAALAFCRDHVCVKCRVHPAPWGWEGSFVENRYYVSCPKCRNKIHEGEYIRVEEADAAERNQRIGEKQMRDDPKGMTTEQAMKDLGY